MLETELFLPIKELLENQGYQVKGEIGAIDILAVKDEEVVAIELKTSITLKLIYQAIERQKIADIVYIAIPKSATVSHQNNIRSFHLLLRRLSIGLMVISKQGVEISLDAKDYDLNQSRNKNKKTKNKLLSEFKNRSSNKNLGGMRGKKMTFYREQALEILKVLHAHPGISPKEIKILTTNPNVSSILQKNYYGWFHRIERGSYTLSEKGIQEINNGS
ncbi:MAG: DUF2161 family putative PD-(D/E)XK-type phosphodiesterase [Acholeplasmataceae bacterium]|nr:DUF2161 family putative PD-(D/E)XK-type phosphodiesterase [Acholeplasmataceae bacterium]